MSSKTVESSDNVCVVCFKNVDIYSIGNCDHMVCYECSTRMRVLCCQNECPICRQDLPKVIFTRVLRPFTEVAKLAPYEEKKYKINFQDRRIQDAFYKLLEHCCLVCKTKPSFKTFQNLYDHMRREHELYYCDLCIDNLKIFTSERRCYNKAQLSIHRQKGDPDDRSHRGHPLCEFCQVRYMDNDFLYRHLRKDHLFCHFCDADGHDLYYNSYDYLRDHFREEHYLCEEGACMDEKFTPVFRTEIDLKAHRMSVHGKSMGKAAAKQARTLELEFTLKPRPRQDGSRKGKFTNSDISHHSEEGAVGLYEEQPPRMNSPTLDPSEFPSLPSGSGTVPASVVQRRGRATGVLVQPMGRSRNARLEITDENFPVLGESSNSSQGTLVRLNVCQERSDVSSRNGPLATPRNVSVPVNHRPNGEKNVKIKQDDFPALSSDSGPSVSMPKWVSAPTKSTTSNSPPKQSKNKKSSMTDEDFPSLNSKFNINLNLKAKEPLKTNYVNIRNEEGKQAKKTSSAVIPEQNHLLESVEAGGSSLKTKVKKKKAKANNVIEERSDTAKKKNEKDVHNTMKDKSAKIENNSSALSGNGTPLVKPLPTVRDWFGDYKKLNVKSGSEAEEVNGNSGPSQSSNASVTSPSVKSNSPKNTKCSKVDRNCLTKGEKHAPGKSERKIPPGFDNVNRQGRSGSDSNNPPPGFAYDIPCSNGITFTSSSGQSFAIAANYSYTPPPNFEKRNQDLVAKVFQILSNDGRLEQFKKMSALFRQDMVSADEYYNQCMKTLGDKGFKKIFTELLILLPDINKQQELFRVFSSSPKYNRERTPLQSCETCLQVLCHTDVKDHLAQHSLQENFPLLLSNSWTK